MHNTKKGLKRHTVNQSYPWWGEQRQIIHYHVV